MKTTLWLTTFAMFAASPLGFSETEAKNLRSMVDERERQIRQLEEENMKLRSMNGQETKASTAKTSSAAAPASNSENSEKKQTSSAPSSSSKASTKPSSGSSTYTIKAGDTLVKIGRKVGTSSETLARLNGIKDPTKLKIGQQIKLPSASATSSKGRTATASSATKPSPEPAKNTPSSSSDTHLVRKGETFYSIARKYKVSANSLIAANPDIKPSELHAGQLVRLRGQGSPSTAAASARKSTETASTTKTASTPKTTLPAKSEPVPAAKTATAPKSESVANTEPTPAVKQNATASQSHPKSTSPEKAPSSSAPASTEPSKGPVKSVVIDGQMTYGEFAAKHGTQIERLNELNGLDLPQNTVLAKGSELYVNAQP